MKKKVLFLAILVFFSINLVSAVEIQLNKEVYLPGETLQAEIYGNFIDKLDLNSIHLYRDRQIPIIFDLFKLKDKYLFYAVLPYTEGNYTLAIENREYTTETGTSSEDVVTQFKINSENQSTLISVNPGFIVTKDDFFIRVKANRNTDLDGEFEATGEKTSFSLIQNQEKKVYFSVEDINEYTESNLKIGDYNIPVIIFPKKSEEEIIRENGDFRFSPSEIKATILSGKSVSFKISLLNLGKINITDISLSHDSDETLELELSRDSISKLEAEDEEELNLTIKTEEKEGNFFGIVVARVGNLSTELLVDITITNNESEVSYEDPYIQQLSCSDLGGQICPIGQFCNIPSELSREGYCCKGTCTSDEEPNGGGTAWIWGILILVLVAGGGGYLFYYMKKKQKKPEEVLAQRQKRFQERMKGKEVRGGLSKI